MKKTALIFAFFITISMVNAQNETNNNIETLFSKPSKIRAYIGPIINFTNIDGETEFMIGKNAALIFNDHVIFGFYKMGIENNIFSNDDNYIGSDLIFNQKGLFLGYIFMPKSMVHFNLNTQLGKGNLEIYDNNLNDWLYDDAIFVVTPGIEVEFNIAKFLRMGIAANYRFAFDVNQITNYNDSNFSDFGASVSFKFGWFK